MRLCSVNGKKALFHCWEQKVQIVYPSESGKGKDAKRETIRYVNGIVEYEDGRVDSVSPYKIMFQDTGKLLEKTEKEINKWKEKQISVIISHTESE